jgi:predicted ATP-binding protein involved in virulence
MRIDRLYIKNFKGFEERELTFGRPLNAPVDAKGSVHLVIGENGTGKTSVLDALAVALGVWHLGIGGQGARGIQKSEVRIAASGGNGRVNFDEQVPVKIDASGEIGGLPLQWHREVRVLGGHTLRGGASEALEQIRTLAASARAGDEKVLLPLIAYYGAGRLWKEPNVSRKPRKTAAKKSVRFSVYKNCLDSRCRARDLNNWLLDYDWMSYQFGEEDPEYSLVKKSILACLPGARNLRFAPTRGEVVVDFENRSEQPFSNLSDGQRNMLALVGDLAVKAVKLNHKQCGDKVLRQTSGVVLIDEIDLHLHPTWQRVVLENLRTTFPNLQFIATTHSPFVVQSLREDELVLLDGQPVPETGNLGIEAIAKGLMGVDHPEVSPRYEEMKQVAKDYLTTLEEAAVAPDERLAEFEKRLADGIAPYADNPAFQAFLEMERAAALGQRRGTSGSNLPNANQ